MEIYIGMDVHAQSTTCAVMGPDGQRLKLQVIETSREALTGLLQSIEGNKHVCFEEGTSAAWIYEVVTPLVVEAICCQPKKRSGPKSDAHDAWRLAEDLRRRVVDRIVYKGVGKMAALRDAMRAHRLLTQDVTRIKNRIKSVYRSRGIQATSSKLFESKQRDEWLAKLTPVHRELAAMLHRQLDVVVPLQEEAEKTLIEESKAHAAIDWLTSIPGIGPIRAAYIVAIVVNPRRFPSKREFWSYCGLAVVTESSGDWRRVRGQWMRTTAAKPRGLNTNRNPWLKEVFKAAALCVAAARGASVTDRLRSDDHARHASEPGEADASASTGRDGAGAMEEAGGLRLQQTSSSLDNLEQCRSHRRAARQMWR